MKFPDVTQNTFTKNSCSPSSDLKAESILLANLPKEIEWGQPLPVCGFIKAPQYLDVTVRILSKTQDLIPGVIGSSIDLVPTLSSSKDAVKIFKQQGYLYFNANVLSQERNPPPGHYTIVLEGYDGKTKVSAEVHIQAKGKKYEFVKTLAGLICKHDVVSKYQDYFNSVSALESCSDPMPGSKQKEPSPEELKKNIHNEWKKVWPKYSQHFSQFQKSDLIQWAGYYEEKSIVHALDELLVKNCPQQRAELLTTVHLRFLVESFIELSR